MELNKQQVKDIISPSKYDDAKLQKIADSLNQTFAFYHIDSELRICHFLAQVLHESSAFRYTAEIWGNTPEQKRYDTRTDLGNSAEEDGDGYLYRGRGWIQLTGKDNYIQAGKAFNQDFVANPDLVQQYPWAALVSGWYWDSRQLNQYADTDDVMTITRKVNGGYNGIDDRNMWLARAKSFVIIPPSPKGMQSGKVIASKLNVRENPAIDAVEPVAHIPKNSSVTVLEDQNGWLRVKTEVTGWVKKEFIQLNS